jgi:protease IV
MKSCPIFANFRIPQSGQATETEAEKQNHCGNVLDACRDPIDRLNSACMDEHSTSPELPPVPPSLPPAQPPPPLLSARPAQTSRPRRSLGWMIAALILFCLLCTSLLFHFSGLFKGVLAAGGGLSREAGPRLEEAVLKSSSSRNKIAVVSVEGIIMSGSVDGSGYNLVELMEEQLKRAGEDERVRAVVLKVDSPGGEVLASDEIYQALLKFQREQRKPVVVSMGSLAASGGYYVSAPCQWIVANEMTITGSIGVIMTALNYRGLMDKVGLRSEVFKSGKFKDMLRGSKAPEEITPEERKMIQDLVDETYQRFKQVVREGRAFAKGQNAAQAEKGASLVSNWADYADGRVFSGKEALKLGFVDELGDFNVAVKRAKTLAGIQEASLVQYQQVFDLSNILRLFGKTELKSVNVNMGLDLPKLKTGQLYFLSPTFVY